MFNNQDPFRPQSCRCQNFLYLRTFSGGQQSRKGIYQVHITWRTERSCLKGFSIFQMNVKLISHKCTKLLAKIWRVNILIWFFWWCIQTSFLRWHFAVMFYSTRLVEGIYLQWGDRNGSIVARNYTSHCFISGNLAVLVLNHFENIERRRFQRAKARSLLRFRIKFCREISSRERARWFILKSDILVFCFTSSFMQVFVPEKKK